MSQRAINDTAKRANSRRCAFLAALVALSLAVLPIHAQRAVPTPPLPRAEFRAAWIATVDNIDWPSKKGLPTEQARKELAAIVDTAAALRLNALVFQVRPAGDACYRSDREPWSEWLTGAQGQAPDADWDPLQFLLERAHGLGIEVHAWFNPFRARHPAGKSPVDRRHFSQRMPEACVQFGDLLWMDPGDERAQAWSLAVIADVVGRYDVDGIHLDDYFYPYPKKGVPFADDGSWQRYRLAGGRLPRGDWRRANIDTFVAELERRTHDSKPHVKVGISPFGIARKGVPRGIEAGIDQYDELYADVLGWLARGQIDYLSPQLYWPIDQKAQSFALLLPWWCGQNPQRRHIWPGLNASRAIQYKPPWRQDEIAQQIELVRAQIPAPGHVLFSWKALQNERLRQSLAATHEQAAPVPASPWLDPDAALPTAPELQLVRLGSGVTATVKLPAPAPFFCVQVLLEGRWRTLAVRGAGGPAVAVPAGATAVAARAISRTGEPGPADVAVVD